MPYVFKYLFLYILMKERNLIILLITIFAIIGLTIVYFSMLYSGFNFYKSELIVKGNTITETLTFNTNKPYHTLYRDFQTPATTSTNNEKNTIVLSNVECQQGTAYFRESSFDCTIFRGDIKVKENCPAYTENNEYGCTFGNVYGFSKNQNYFIKSTYTLNPINLFQIKGKNYIKFVAYSESRHKFLSDNLKVSPGVIREKNYFPKEQVILYIPYNGDIQGINIIKQSDFEFDSIAFEFILLCFFGLLPSLLFFLAWFIFGREHSFADIPPELSMFPQMRKPWEVATFFNPPFGKADKNFFASMLLNFYHKKVIDIQMRKKDVWIKLNKHKQPLDKIEKMFLELLMSLYLKDPWQHNKDKVSSFVKELNSKGHFINQLIDKNPSKKYIDGEWIFLKKALSSWNLSSYVQYAFHKIEKEIKNEKKKYIDSKGEIAIVAIFIGFFFFLQIAFIPFLAQSGFMVILFMAFLFVAIIVNAQTTLFIKFKESYYKEYQHWQAFKKYLSNSFSMTHGDHKAVTIWDHYLVYATALGVSKKVLKELKQAGIIDERHYVLYTGIYTSSGSFATSTGASGSGGGGFGGAGGGGMGGGGGGGR